MARELTTHRGPHREGVLGGQSTSPARTTGHLQGVIVTPGTRTTMEGGVPCTTWGLGIRATPIAPICGQPGTLPMPFTQTTGSGVALSSVGVPRCLLCTTQSTPSAVITPPVATPFSLPMLGQIQPIPRFTGEGHGSGNSFTEWHEQFENVAKLVGWDDHWKLVHLTQDCTTPPLHSIVPVVWMFGATTKIWQL